MRGNNAFQNGSFEGRRFVEFLPFEDVQRLTDDISFVGITTGVDETIHKPVQRRRKGDCHADMVIHSRILSRPGLR